MSPSARKRRAHCCATLVLVCLVRRGPIRGNRLPRVEPRRVSRIGILTYFIFGNLESFARFAVQYGAYPFSSMPTNSCLIAIHMKPLSTWILLVFITVIATTNKICTTDGSTHPHGTNASKPRVSTSLYMSAGYFTSADNQVQVYSFERHSFSGLINSMGELLHSHNRIPTSMATVPLS